MKKALLSGQYDFVRCNFPNPGRCVHCLHPSTQVDGTEQQQRAEGMMPLSREKCTASTRTPTHSLLLAPPDMVGHTGNLQACIEAVTVTDACVKVGGWLQHKLRQAGSCRRPASRRWL